MTSGSSPSPADAANAVSQVEPDLPADARRGGEDVSDLATPMTDPAVVSLKNSGIASSAVLPVAATDGPDGGSPDVSQAHGSTAVVPVPAATPALAVASTPTSNAPRDGAPPAEFDDLLHPPSGAPDTKIADDAPLRETTPSVIVLPDWSGSKATEADADFDDSFFRHIADAPSVSSDRSYPTDDADGSAANGTTAAPAPVAYDDERREVSEGSLRAPSEPVDRAISAAESRFGESLLPDFADADSVSSDEVARSPSSAVDLDIAESRSDNIASAPGAPPVDVSFDQVRVDDVRSPPDVAGDQATTELETMPLEAIPAAPAAALAFATDSDTDVVSRTV